MVVVRWFGMRLVSLWLENFRVYREARVEFPLRATVILGENAQGKTSVLEAICALARTKSHRTNRDEEMVRWGADQARVEGKFERRVRGPVSLRMVLTSPEAAQFLGQPVKQLAVNSEAVRGPREVIGQVAVVAFSPEDLVLAKGEPSVRRRFLNVAIGGIEPAHLADLQQYTRALRQRNELLSLVAQGTAGAEELYSWDRQLARYGAEVTLARARYVAELSAAAATIHRKLTSGEESLAVRYRSNVWEEETDQASVVEGLILDKLAARRSQDLALRRTVVGPHRDDLVLEVDGRDLRRFGSQGQQRTAALALRLAEARVATRRMGEAPIVLLDDCLSELDEQRASRVLAQAGDETQLILTTTHLSKVLEGTTETTVYQVRAGELTAA